MASASGLSGSRIRIELTKGQFDSCFLKVQNHLEQHPEDQMSMAKFLGELVMFSHKHEAAKLLQPAQLEQMAGLLCTVFNLIAKLDAASVQSSLRSNAFMTLTHVIMRCFLRNVQWQPLCDTLDSFHLFVASLGDEPALEVFTGSLLRLVTETRILHNAHPDQLTMKEIGSLFSSKFFNLDELRLRQLGTICVHLELCMHKRDKKLCTMPMQMSACTALMGKATTLIKQLHKERLSPDVLPRLVVHFSMVVADLGSKANLGSESERKTAITLLKFATEHVAWTVAAYPKYKPSASCLGMFLELFDVYMAHEACTDADNCLVKADDLAGKVKKAMGAKKDTALIKAQLRISYQRLFSTLHRDREVKQAYF